ncbi:MAG TPA: hypothetical protein VGM02_07090 [Acidobacteriaceae bacterium]|jgi:hypothetical protein
MHGVTADSVLWAATLAAEALLTVVILKSGMRSSYPILLTYLIVNLVEDPLAWILFKGPKGIYYHFYFTVTVLDYLLQFLLVVEIGRNVFAPSKRSIPFRLWPVVTSGVLICTIIAAIFSPRFQANGLNASTQWFATITLGLAVLKVLLFVALAGFAQLLGIGWKSRVLQLASGLAFYGAASLLVQLAIHHIEFTNQASYESNYVRLTQIQSGAYLCTLVFWIWAFSRNEAPRKDFTPQMQEVLVTIAESAKRTRLAVTRSGDRR